MTRDVNCSMLKLFLLNVHYFPFINLIAWRGLDWLQSFLFYIYFSLSLHYFFIMTLYNPTSSYLWVSSQGTEVNKNSTSYTSVVSPHKKRRKRKKRKIKKGSGARLGVAQRFYIDIGPAFTNSIDPAQL